MTNEQQPEALRLADLIDANLAGAGDAEISSELRRLHAENEDYGATIDYLTCENAEQIGEIVALKEQHDELLAVLRMARESIGDSLQSLIETETHPVTGMVEHEGALLVIESEQDMLNQIDSAIAKAGGAA